MKNKKIYLSLLFLGVISILFGVTYSFFNYTRTGSENTFSVGRIFFKSDNEEVISLSNLFPIDPSDTNEMNDPTKVGTYSIDITGDTDYEDGLEYLVSVVDSNINKLPINVNINVSSGLGTSSDDYFNERENKNANIYKRLVKDTITGDGMLLVGYIKPNSTSGEIEGVDGTISINAYLDRNKVAITDTYGIIKPITDPGITVREYIVNPNMSAAELASCVSFLNTQLSFSGTDAEKEAFCQGDTSQFGSIEELFDSLSDDLQEELVQSNVFIANNNTAPEVTYTNGTTDKWVDRRTILSTDEWNSLSTNGVSFKIKVEANEGIWVNGPLEEIMRKSAVIDNISSDFVTSSSGINFGAISSNTNGKGVYLKADTQNDLYPVVYYRGAVENNNVVFNNKCWKAIRTTENGGVKLLYNGEAKDLYSQEALTETKYTVDTNVTDQRWSFDSTDNSWNIDINDGTSPNFVFNVPTGGDYSINAAAYTAYGCSGTVAVYKNDTYLQQASAGYGSVANVNYNLGVLNSSDTLKVNYNGGSSDTCVVRVKIAMQGPGEFISSNACNSTGLLTQISDNDGTNFAFNTFTGSLASFGYTHGNTYDRTWNDWSSNVRFGSSFTWDGTKYTLVDDSVTQADDTHHYSCNLTTANGTCKKIRYVYFKKSNIVSGSAVYITLSNGESIEDAIEEMFSSTYNSNVKEKIDAWYSANMNGVTNKLEDAVYCGDRSTGNWNRNGWDPNGGNLDKYLYFNSYGRNYYGSSYGYAPSEMVNKPTVTCQDKRDRYTVNNSNGNHALDFPVALLTEDEVVLAGGVHGTANNSYYLYNGYDYWTMTPADYDYRYAYIFYVRNNGSASDGSSVNQKGLRPVITIKSGQPVVSGTGTSLDPYIIE